MRRRQTYWLTALPVVAGSVLMACGSKKKDSADDPATTPSEPTIAGTTNPAAESPEALLRAFPSDLVLSFFSDPSSNALRLNMATESDEDAALADAKRPPIERSQETKQRLKGQAASCAPAILKRKPPLGRGESCYDFDHDQIYGTRDGSNYFGNLKGLNADGEACMVAFAKSKVAVVNDLLERAKAMIETMLCQAKKSDPSFELPTASGDIVNLKTAMASGIDVKADNIFTAELEHLDVDGVSVYRSTVVINRDGKLRSIVLAHSPGEGETYRGSLFTIEHADPDAAKLQDGPGGGYDSSKDKVLSINYARVEDPNAPGTYRMQGQLVRAHLNRDVTDTAVGASGLVDLSAFRNFDVDEDDPTYGKPMVAKEVVDNANTVVSGQTLISFDLTDEGAGTTSYFENPGGNYHEAARGMVAQVAKDDKGRLHGCSISGAALGDGNLMESYSIAKAQKQGITLNPTGYYHPFYILGGMQNNCNETVKSQDDVGFYNALDCTQNGQQFELKWYYPAIAAENDVEEFVSSQMGRIVTRQCYALNQDSGLWEIDQDEISEQAGYELVRTLDYDGTKIIAPPKVGKNVRPFKDGVGRRVD